MEKIALILAAGEGTRMVSDKHKVLHEICGEPMIEHSLRALDQVADKKAVIVGFGKEKVIPKLYGRAEAIEQAPDGWGTGHAVRSAVPFLAGKSGYVIVTAADMPLVLPETYARLMGEVEGGAACAMLTDYAENPIGYGRVIRKDGKICEIVEQKDLTPDQRSINEINGSVYCFDISSLMEALPMLKDDNAAKEYYLTDVVKIFSDMGKLIVAVPVLEKSECRGINDRVQLAQAEKELRGRINARHMRAGVTMIDPENTYIHPDAIIGQDTLLYPGCILGRGSVIGSRVTLTASRVKNSSVGDGAVIEHSVIEDSKVAAGEKIGPFAHLKSGERKR